MTDTVYKQKPEGIIEDSDQDFPSKTVLLDSFVGVPRERKSCETGLKSETGEGGIGGKLCLSKYAINFFKPGDWGVRVRGFPEGVTWTKTGAFVFQRACVRRLFVTVVSKASV